jgi:acetyltransferase-like isoleucine patch superfamily enzyme
MHLEIMDQGRDNALDLDDRLVNGALTVEFEGAGHSVRCGAGTRLDTCRLQLVGKSNAVVIGSHCDLKLKVRIRTNGAMVEIGDRTTILGAELDVRERKHISIGRDCMVSRMVWITTSDMHPIYDTQTGKRVNPGKDVVIHDHVWIGRGAKILKGAVIGAGSVIGTGAIVAGTIPESCVAVGVPAKVIRRGIVWKMSTTPAKLEFAAHAEFSV